MKVTLFYMLLITSGFVWGLSHRDCSKKVKEIIALNIKASILIDKNLIKKAFDGNNLDLLTKEIAKGDLLIQDPIFHDYSVEMLKKLTEILNYKKHIFLTFTDDQKTIDQKKDIVNALNSKAYEYCDMYWSYFADRRIDACIKQGVILMQEIDAGCSLKHRMQAEKDGAPLSVGLRYYMKYYDKK